jgi:hypothetical protein
MCVLDEIDIIWNTYLIYSIIYMVHIRACAMIKVKHPLFVPTLEVDIVSLSLCVYLINSNFVCSLFVVCLE